MLIGPTCLDRTRSKRVDEPVDVSAFAAERQ